MQSTADDPDSAEHEYLQLIETLKEAVLSKVRAELRAEECKVAPTITRIRPRESLEESRPEPKLHEPKTGDFKTKLDETRSRRSPPPIRNTP